MHIDLDEGLYVLALSLQLAGASMLVKFVLLKGKRKNILEEIIDNKPDFDGGEESKTVEELG